MPLEKGHCLSALSCPPPELVDLEVFPRQQNFSHRVFRAGMGFSPQDAFGQVNTPQLSPPASPPFPPTCGRKAHPVRADPPVLPLRQGPLRLGWSAFADHYSGGELPYQGAPHCESTVAPINPYR
jgi:hypothetical protein